MTTSAQIAANQENASKSTGPKTVEGKQCVSANARRHGILALAPVIEGVETQEEWEAHHSGILGALNPRGNLEMHLAERVAFSLWRLRRVIRFEHEEVELLQTTTEEYLRGTQPSFPDSLGRERASIALFKSELETTERYADAYRRFRKTEDSVVLSWEDYGALETVLHMHGVLNRKLEDELLKCNFRRAGAMRAFMARVTAVDEDADSVDGFIECRLELLGEKKEKLEKGLRRLAEKVSQHQRCRILPGPDLLDKVTRYESHLHRLFLRDLHELQRLQTARIEGQIPAPAALDITVSGDQAGMAGEPA